MAKILVVDDDNLIRHGIVDMLRAEQHEVIEATNGQEGLTAALAEKPDLVVSDVNMPEMNGPEMITELRKDAWGATVPVIVLSSDETTTSINDVLEAGATVYLSKTTIDPKSMIQQINIGLGTATA